MATATELKKLTDKQQRVFDLLGEGKSPGEIANEMGIRSISGVASHIEALKKKGYLDKNGAPKSGSKNGAASTPDISGGEGDVKTGVTLPADGVERTVEITGNGHHPSFALDEQVASIVTAQAEGLRGMIDGIDKALEAHKARQAEIDAESQAHAKSVEDLTEQRRKADEALRSIS
jgi:hypothetical protein